MLVARRARVNSFWKIGTALGRARASTASKPCKDRLIKRKETMKKLYLLFYAKNDGLVSRAFDNQDEARAHAKDIENEYVSCVVPVALDEAFFWTHTDRRHTTYSAQDIFDRMQQGRAEIARDPNWMPPDNQRTQRDGI